MRRVLAVAALVAAAALAARAAAASTGPVSGTLTGRITDTFGNCCFTFDAFEGQGVVKHIGKVAFTGETGGGCGPAFVPGEIPTCIDELDVTLSTHSHSGATLEASSFVSWLST